MMVSKNPVEDRALKVTAGTMIVMIVILTCLRACQFIAHKAEWCGLSAKFINESRALLAARDAR